MPPQRTPRLSSPALPRPNSNGVLAALPADVQQRLIARAARVPLERCAVLIEAGAPQPHVYLPCSGLLSLQTRTQDGNSIEVAMVGREGIAALPAIGGTTAAYTTVVTVSGEALCLRADALQAECEHNVPLQRRLLHQWHAMIGEIANGSACHRFHSARQRLARWLLMASDRIQSSGIELTQAQLSEILGLHRTVVTAANVALQDAGAVASRYGRVRVADRVRLQQAACECYRCVTVARR
jgi:CRP-like cAMP-binding protein